MKLIMTEKEKLGKEYFILQEFLMQNKVDLENIGFELDKSQSNTDNLYSNMVQQLLSSVDDTEIVRKKEKKKE